MEISRWRQDRRVSPARAGLRPPRFRDLRHTFGSLAINRARIVQVQAWMGHADAEQEDEAELLADAFPPATGRAALGAMVAGEQLSTASRAEV
jgi:integrase